MTITATPFTRGGLLRALGEELDPPREEQRLARQRYGDLGAWLKSNVSSDRDVAVYPQGSFNLGTTNRDLLTGEFDIDLVLRVDYGKDEITQAGLNRLVNGWLGGYVSSCQDQRHPFAPTGMEKGKRAWTLFYDGFHMDVLPVIPDLHGDLDATGGDPSWLTDKALRLWQPTNPRGFAEWFERLSKTEKARLVEFAKRAEVEVADLPQESVVKTSLQLLVQLLKRHRDNMFGDDPEGLAPPSALVTALVCKAYEEELDTLPADLDAALEHVVVTMPKHIGWNGENPVVTNPACESENYADRYRGHPTKTRSLLSWLDRVAHDLGRVRKSIGSDTGDVLDDTFGPGLGSRVAKRIGETAQRLRAAGSVATSSSGALAVASIGHRSHTFYGTEAEH